MYSMGSKGCELIGLYFHTFEGNDLCRQGQVISSIADGLYLVEFFGWADGNSAEMKLVGLEDMLEWVFYRDCDSRDNRLLKWSKQRWG